MSTTTQVDPESPLAKAWEEYQGTDDFANSSKWAAHVEHPHLQGSLWAVFMAGFDAGQKAARHPEESDDADPGRLVPPHGSGP